MRIHQAALAAQMTEKNIRFYESQGLLNPAREGGNGYRSYTDAQVETLKQIKLLRTLEVPIPDIRDVLEGKQELAAVMAAQQDRLGARQKGLAAAAGLCESLQSENLQTLDLPAAQESIRDAQRKGARFMDVRKQDKSRKTMGAVLSVAVVLLFLGSFAGLFAWGIATDPAGPPPLLLTLLIFAVIGACMVGAILVLIQRLQEIKEEKIDAYRDY